MAENFIVRNGLENELDAATLLGVSVLPGWHVSPHELSCAFALDPTTFYLGKLNDVDEPISLVNATKYPDHSAFISAFVVKKEHRGKGYGKQTWDTAWKCLDHEKLSVGLDALTDMVPKYECLGFRSVWNTVVVILDLEMVVKEFADIEIPPGVSIKPLSSIDMAELIKYDSFVFGTSRDKLIEKWIDIPGSQGWAAVDKGAASLDTLSLGRSSAELEWNLNR